MQLNGTCTQIQSFEQSGYIYRFTLGKMETNPISSVC